MSEKFSTNHPHFFPQRRTFYVDALREFSTSFAYPCFFHIYVLKIIYTKYLTQPCELRKG